MSEIKVREKEFSEEELRYIQEILLKALKEKSLTPEEIEEIERFDRMMSYISPEKLLRPFTI